MRKKEMLPPPVQQALPFACSDLWSKLPESAREVCQRLIAQQMKKSLEYDHQQESQDERKDSA